MMTKQLNEDLNLTWNQAEEIAKNRQKWKEIINTLYD